MIEISVRQRPIGYEQINGFHQKEGIASVVRETVSNLGGHAARRKSLFALPMDEAEAELYRGCALRMIKVFINIGYDLPNL